MCIGGIALWKGVIGQKQLNNVASRVISEVYVQVGGEAPLRPAGLLKTKIAQGSDQL